MEVKCGATKAEVFKTISPWLERDVLWKKKKKNLTSCFWEQMSGCPKSRCRRGAGAGRWAGQVKGAVYRSRSAWREAASMFIHSFSSCCVHYTSDVRGLNSCFTVASTSSPAVGVTFMKWAFSLMGFSLYCFCFLIPSRKSNLSWTFSFSVRSKFKITAFLSTQEAELRRQRRLGNSVEICPKTLQ